MGPFNREAVIALTGIGDETDFGTYPIAGSNLLSQLPLGRLTAAAGARRAGEPVLEGRSEGEQEVLTGRREGSRKRASVRARYAELTLGPPPTLLDHRISHANRTEEALRK